MSIASLDSCLDDSCLEDSKQKQGRSSSFVEGRLRMGRRPKFGSTSYQVAQLRVHWPFEREVAGSNPGQINTQGLNITEEKVLFKTSRMGTINRWRLGDFKETTHCSRRVGDIGPCIDNCHLYILKQRIALNVRADWHSNSGYPLLFTSEQ